MQFLEVFVWTVEIFLLFDTTDRLVFCLKRANHFKIVQKTCIYGLKFSLNTKYAVYLWRCTIRLCRRFTSLSFLRWLIQNSFGAQDEETNDENLERRKEQESKLMSKSKHEIVCQSNWAFNLCKHLEMCLRLSGMTLLQPTARVSVFRLSSLCRNFKVNWHNNEARDVVGENVWPSKSQKGAKCWLSTSFFRLLLKLMNCV